MEELDLDGYTEGRIQYIEEPMFIDTIPVKVYAEGEYLGRLRKFPDGPRWTDPTGEPHDTLEAAVLALTKLPEGASRDAFSGDEPEHQSRRQHGGHMEVAPE